MPTPYSVFVVVVSIIVIVVLFRHLYRGGPFDDGPSGSV